jgi:hypothetical protein
LPSQTFEPVREEMRENTKKKNNDDEFHNLYEVTSNKFPESDIFLNEWYYMGYFSVMSW